MYTCSDDHDEVSYHADVCPVCACQIDLSLQEDELIEAQAEIDSLNGQISSLQEELDSFEMLDEPEGITT